MMLVRGTIETMGVSVPGVIQDRTPPWGLSWRAARLHAGLHSPQFSLLLSRHVYLDEQWVTAVTPAQKTAWGAFAAGNTWRKESGRAVALNKYQVFIKINLTRLGLGLPYSPTPPAGSNPGVAVITAYTFPAPGHISITFDNSLPWTTDAGSFCLTVDHGPIMPTWQQRKQFARALKPLPGIPGIGYPAPVIFTRPYDSSIPPFALLRTYVFKL